MSKGDFTPVVEMMPIENLKPYDRNVKIHDEEQIQGLANVIRTQGWDVPIVVDRHNVIIKGHGRRLAAMSLGMTTVPVIVRRDLTPAQVKAARLSDNRVAITGFDTEMMRDEMRLLSDEGELDMGMLGFNDKELTMFTEDIAAFNGEVFSDSARPSVEESIADGTAPAAVGKKEIQAHEILGFKTIPDVLQRPIAQFIAFAQSATGKSGVEAFAEFCKSAVTNHLAVSADR